MLNFFSGKNLIDGGDSAKTLNLKEIKTPLRLVGKTRYRFVDAVISPVTN